MAIERLRSKARQGKLQVPGLLDVIGVPRVGVFKSRRYSAGNREKSRGGFWVRNAPHLEAMLHEIHSSYRRTIRRVHPDAPGGSHKECTQVNLAWGKIRKWFAQRGVVLVVLLLTGCVRFQVIQTDESPDERIITTRITGVAFTPEPEATPEAAATKNT